MTVRSTVFQDEMTASHYDPHWYTGSGVYFASYGYHVVNYYDVSTPVPAQRGCTVPVTVKGGFPHGAYGLALRASGKLNALRAYRFTVETMNGGAGSVAV